MKLAFKKTDILTGGQYADLFYDYFIQNPQEVEKQGQWRIVEVDEADVPYSWFKNNYANIKWEGVSIWVEVPIALASSSTPAFLPNRMGTDENGDSYVKTLSEWYPEPRTRLDASKFLLKLDAGGVLTPAQMIDAIALIEGNVNYDGYLISEARNLVNGILYTTPE